MLKRYALFLLLASAGMLSCSKKTTPKPQAFVRLIHGVPDAANLDLAPDGNVLIGGVGFGSASDYRSVDAGGFNVRIQLNGATSVLSNGDVVADAGKYYTLVVTDSLYKSKSSIILDNRTDPPAGKAFIRFFHLVGNGPAYDLKSGAANLFTNRSFNDQAGGGTGASYVEIAPGTLSFEVRQSSGGSIAALLSNVTITAGKSYTIVAKGFVGGADKQALGISLFTDK